MENKNKIEVNKIQIHSAINIAFSRLFIYSVWFGLAIDSVINSYRECAYIVVEIWKFQKDLGLRLKYALANYRI